MVENIEKLLDRDEKLSIIATKSNNLNERSKNVNYMVAKIKKQEKMKQYKTMLMIGGGVLVSYLCILALGSAFSVVNYSILRTNLEYLYYIWYLLMY